MAARLRPHQDAKAREAIRTSQLVNRLQRYALGEPDPQAKPDEDGIKRPVEMSDGQIRATIALLKKTIPDLQVAAVMHSGSVEVRHIEWTVHSNEPKMVQGSEQTEASDLPALPSSARS